VRLLAVLGSASLASGQETVATRPTPADAESRAADNLLARPASLDVTRVSRKRALDVLARSAGVPIQYKSQVLDAYPEPVTIHLVNVPLRVALDSVLAGTALHVVVDGTNKLAVTPVSSEGHVAAGSVSGQVTDSRTKRPLARVAVMLDDSTHVTRTDDAGHFRFASVAAGDHRITVRTVGYARQTRVVTVTDDASVTVSFALESSVNTLDQVVVTATGEQRYRELGHVVAKINADSLVKNAPITSVAELLTARVPGLEVMTSNGGMAGGDVSLRLRGQTTTSLDPQPIVIVDGVRYRNTTTIPSGTASGAFIKDVRPYSAEQRSPLNDLNVNDIETVEVVKGPSASTLYGPDAANGVILITTKRAKAGKTEWHFFAHPRLNDISNSGGGNMPTHGYWAWGHDPNTGEAVNYSCTLVSVYYQQCVQDSITVAPTIAADQDLSVIAQNRPQWQYGANVGGGTDALRYYLSAGYDTQVGSLRIPPAAAQILVQRLGASALSDAVKNPNTQQMATIHSSITAAPTAKTTVILDGSYAQISQRSINANVYRNQSGNGVVQPNCSTSDPNCRGFTDDDLHSGAFIQTSTQEGQHLVGNATGNVQATSWLAANAVIGFDLNNTTDRGVTPSGALYQSDGGSAVDSRRNNVNRTATVIATARAHPGRFSFRTSLGGTYNYQHLDGLDASGYNLAPGSNSITTAQYQQNIQQWTETVSLDGFGEEVVGLNDRLFLTGGLRMSGSTSFGDAYKARPYPKIGLSWIASEEPFLRHLPGVEELRFRSSFGASSRYPVYFMKAGQIQSNLNMVDGMPQNIYSRYYLPNQFLRPERTREAEYGVDATLLSGIVTTGLTWHRRRTNDELQLSNYAQGLPPQWMNLGNISAHGFEATAEVHLLERSSVRASLQFMYSHQRDKLLSLGDKSLGMFDMRVGYPLASVFQFPFLGYVDTVGGIADHIILSQEVVKDSISRFIGVTVPPTTFGVTPSVSFFGGWLRASTSIDRQTGFVVAQSNAYNYGLSLAPLLQSTPLIEQALYQYQPLYIAGDFTRWRELTVSMDLPTRMLRHVMLSRGTVNFQVRNLALWTHYAGSDPESTPDAGALGSNPQGYGSSGIPLARSWTISFDVTP